MNSDIKGIVLDGHESGKDVNEILAQMLVAGVAVGKLNLTYTQIMVDAGLMIDPKEVVEEAKGYITQVDWAEYEDWDQVESAIQAITDEVDGAEESKILSLVRAHCRAEEIALPRRSGGGRPTGARGSAVKEAITTLFSQDDLPTKQAIYDALYKAVKGEKKHQSATHYLNTYAPVAYAIKQGVSLNDALTELAKQDDPVDPESKVEEQAEAA